MIIPEHIAIIPDGNRRWARRKGLPAMVGHAQGAVALQNIVGAAAKYGIKTLTVYTFSTENWSRSNEEVDTLLKLFKKNLIDLREMMVAQGVRFDTIGDLSRFPEDLLKELQKTKEATKEGTQIELVLAMNYGGRDEICRAVKTILEECAGSGFKDLNLTESTFARYLDTAKWKDPELFIRTSGEKRLSNFLLWQLSYAEVYITEVLWPDFDEKELQKALIDFQKRERRRGK
jgi:undecaprenyl diphosphate synthase